MHIVTVYKYNCKFTKANAFARSLINLKLETFIHRYIDRYSIVLFNDIERFRVVSKILYDFITTKWTHISSLYYFIKNKLYTGIINSWSHGDKTPIIWTVVSPSNLMSGNIWKSCNVEFLNRWILILQTIWT